MPDLPDACFGTAETPLPDWRREDEDVSDDDDVLEETPSDVVEMLGFDPLAQDTDDGLIGSIGSTLKKTGSLSGSSLTESVRAGDLCACDSCRRHRRGLT